MRVIVTRPEREAQRWVHELSALGFDAQALPLIKVGPVSDTAHLVHAWHQLADYVGVMFVSANAVAHFFAARPPAAPEFGSAAALTTRAWATGPGTARALASVGVAPERLDAPPMDSGQFDSEALWQCVGAQVHQGDRVLIVRGGDSAGSAGAGQGSGREWFARRVTEAGAQADFVMAYQRHVPEFSLHEQTLACQAATDGSVWLFSSTEAVGHLGAWLPGQSWGQARALATHARIAAAAKKLGFGVVGESRPTLADVVAAIQRVG